MFNFLKFWNKSAKQYNEYSAKYPQYIKTNEKLVELANIKSNQIIVDLACGICQLLQNPFYYGKILWQGKVYEGKHKPIISKDLFEQSSN